MPVAESPKQNWELPVEEKSVPNDEVQSAEAAAAVEMVNRRSGSSGGGSGGRGRGRGGSTGSRMLHGMSPLNVLSGYNNNNKTTICTTYIAIFDFSGRTRSSK